MSLFWPSNPSNGAVLAKCSLRVSTKKRGMRRQRRNDSSSGHSKSSLSQPNTLIGAHQDFKCHTADRAACSSEVPCNETYLLLDASQNAESLDLTLCHQSPELILAESELSDTDVSPPVFYHEEKEIPGICVDREINHSVGLLLSSVVAP